MANDSSDIERLLDDLRSSQRYGNVTAGKAADEIERLRFGYTCAEDEIERLREREMDLLRESERLQSQLIRAERMLGGPIARTGDERK